MDTLPPTNDASSQQAGPDLWSQLGNAVNLVGKQDQIVWAVFGIFWAANAVLLVALFNTAALPQRSAGLIVSVVGVILSLVWFLVQLRAIGFLSFYEAVMEALERQLLAGHQDVTLSAKLNELVFRRTVRGVRTRPLVIASCLVSFIAWLAAVGYFLCIAPRAG